MEEKKSRKSVSDKILFYKKNLESVPKVLVSVEQSERDREEINGKYNIQDTTRSQILDSKFYSLLVNMNRERDKYFLREGTTRKERISILSKIILKITTPMLILNQKRVVNIDQNTFYGTKTFTEKKLEFKVDEHFTELENQHVEIPQLSDSDLNEIKTNLLSTLDKTEWESVDHLNAKFGHWEADIFSQLVRDKKLIITKNQLTGKLSIFSIKEGKNKSSLSVKRYSILLQPSRVKES